MQKTNALPSNTIVPSQTPVVSTTSTTPASAMATLCFFKLWFLGFGASKISFSSYKSPISIHNDLQYMRYLTSSVRSFVSTKKKKMKNAWNVSQAI